MKPLLLLVDLQRDYLDAPGLRPPADAIIRRATHLLEGSRTAAVDVAHVWTTVSRQADNRMPHWKREGRWLCEEGAPGHPPPPALAPAPGEPVIHKTHFDPFSGTALDDLIRERGSDLLVICGVHLHGCVRQAVLAAYERGLETWVAEDAVGSDEPVHAAITRRYLERRATRFTSADEALERMRAGAPPAPTPGDEIARAAGSCRAAQPEWSARSPRSRLEVLARLAAALESEAAGLADLMADEIGKPVSYGTPEARRTAQMLGAVAAHALEAAPDGLPAAALHHRLLGAVAIITPWNNPVYIPLGKIAPALAYGNTVLWKPAPAAQRIAERIALLLGRAELPPGVLGLVAGDRQEAEAAMAHPAIDAVSITGSSAAGYSAQEACARRRIPLQAELGGNNAALVWADADLERAATEIAGGAFAQAGQRCTANRRVVVHSSIANRLLDLLRDRTAALAWGDPRDPTVSVGPIGDERARDRIAAAVSEAARHASLVDVPHGTESPPSGSPDLPWYPPTIICCEDPEAEIVQEETFGPVLVVERVGAEVPAGIVKINRSTADAEVDVPFGGWKASGIGPPEHGRFDRDFYTRPQVVYP